MKGISIKEAMCALAKITKEWYPLADYSKLANVFKTIINPSKKAQKALKKFGVEKLK